MDQIVYRPYTSEVDLPDIMALVQSELSEPYVIYTYRFFLNQWPQLAYIAHTPTSRKPIGVVVSKQDIHKGKANRGYIAMLSVSREWRKRGIATQLVRLSIASMIRNGAEEVTLETEYDNSAALSLYASLGFIREKRLFRFYMSGKDAFRLVLPLRTPSMSSSVSLDYWKLVSDLQHRAAESQSDDSAPPHGGGGGGRGGGGVKQDSQSTTHPALEAGPEFFQTMPVPSMMTSNAQLMAKAVDQSSTYLI